jgi:type VI secretion system FHA domain protein
LKFSADAEAALVSLLGSPRRGYLDAETAFAEAFADLRGHEMALLAGMQEVWRHLIGRFDPKALEARVGEDSGLGGLIGSKKARCWDAFVTLYETLAGGADDDLRLVERIFAEAYDSHIDRQRQDGRGSRE